MRSRKAEVVERDFFKVPFTAAELEKLVSDRPIAEFISTRATSYKTTGWDKKPPTKKQAIKAMLQDPTLLRRPILVIGKKRVIGWSQEAYAKLYKAWADEPADGESQHEPPQNLTRSFREYSSTYC